MPPPTNPGFELIAAVMAASDALLRESQRLFRPHGLTAAQYNVLNLLADIQDETGVSYVLISHDLAVVRQLAEQVIVLWKGQIVEQGQTGDVLDNPQHEYTQRLRASVPRPGWKPARRIAS